MLIELLLDLLYNVFSLLTSFINIPSLPATVDNYLGRALEYLGTGISILGAYVNISLLLTLFGIIVAFDIGVHLYHFVMWILKKIPMLGIE